MNLWSMEKLQINIRWKSTGRVNTVGIIPKCLLWGKWDATTISKCLVGLGWDWCLRYKHHLIKSECQLIEKLFFSDAAFFVDPKRATGKSWQELMFPVGSHSPLKSASGYSVVSHPSVHLCWLSPLEYAPSNESVELLYTSTVCACHTDIQERRDNSSLSCI